MSRILLIAAVSGFLTVAIGAFAAHGLREALDAQQMAWVETGVHYQAWHSLALLAIAVLAGFRPGRLLFASAAAFAFGILLFSGSLYVLALSGDRMAAIVTPFGGASFLSGWVLLALYAWRQLPRSIAASDSSRAEDAPKGFERK
jgi:uncharacterized membrane protein YgdD (TMEM256/DUF423 family)